MANETEQKAFDELVTISSEQGKGPQMGQTASKKDKWSFHTTEGKVFNILD